MARQTSKTASETAGKMRGLPGSQLAFFPVLLLICLLALLWHTESARAEGSASNSSTRGLMAARPMRPASSAGGVYPEFRSNSGAIHWIKEQMPLKVYVSHGSSIDGFIDQELGAPIANTSNTGAWPDLVANILSTPGQIEGLPVAQGYNEQMYAAACQGISMWKPFEKEGLFSYVLTNEPDADIFVFWVHHFVDKSGMALFAGDIRGLTSKRSFPYRAIMSGGKADFKPVVIMLRTSESNNTPMVFPKVRAAAAHEFGHALGIEGHSRNPSDLMSLYYGNGTVSPNDAATIRYLYHLTPDLIP